MVALVAGVLALALTGVPPGTGGTPRATGQTIVGEVTAQTDDAVPAKEVTMIGSTPQEAGGGRYETWGIGKGVSGPVLVRYAAETGWSLGPGLEGEAGEPLTGPHAFKLDEPGAALSPDAGPSTLAGQLTADGAGVLAGEVEDKQVLLAREPNNPANPFRETKPVPEAVLGGDRLFGFERAPLIAPLDETGGHVGALVVPVEEHGVGVEEDVLHWNSETSEWAKEKIELPSGVSGEDFRVLGIGASSPSNAWLLGELSSAGTVALFHRQHSGGELVWQPVALKSGGEPGEPLAIGEGAHEERITIPGAEKERVQTQVLTVTSQGVWIDGELSNVGASATIFFKPEGETTTSWCTLGRSPTSLCDYALPEPLPIGPSRSIAWASSSEFGERVITGLSEGVSLRLEGTSFNRVLALGGAGSSSVGATYGAAFSEPREGWLGSPQLPVHLTREPERTRLAPWPTSFRHALVAVAPQPDAPIGSLSSEALAVGDLGEVARFKPGKGWLPESLLGAGGKRETPQLRAVAWPSPNRAYAVGNVRPGTAEEDQMWLWRGETGLWEPDPAAPYNFRGNLLGIAFEPGNPARGYAVGESGVLLGYGKTWSQEAFPAENPCSPSAEKPKPEEIQRCASWADASFTSVAFAGSEAIVAYRILPARDTKQYKGGLLVNDGSGWHIDQGATEVMGSNVPWAVAGLENGDAAFGASGMVYEREGPGAAWHAAPTPFPGGGEPGSLALFQEGGALRVVAAGSVPETYRTEAEPEAPPGQPPTLIKPYPLESNPERGVLRQTANGWSDQEHELNDVREPAGHWSFYDTVYQPDPVSAVMIDPTGSQGWAVGGFVEEHEQLDTADIERYPADGSTPLGEGTSAISAEPGLATFAIAGNAQCAAPCADRANAAIGPDVWLENALKHASESDVAAGKSEVRAFLYTGPRLVSPHAINGEKEATETINYHGELERYAEILRSSPIPAYAVATPTDRDEEGSELEFREAFSSFPFAVASTQPESNYYSFLSSGPGGADGPVRVIVLDDSSEAAEVEGSQLEWLERELESAMSASPRVPAIVIGYADLAAQIAAGDHPDALRVEQALITDGASSYFFDSPERNIKETLGGVVPAYGSGSLGYVNYQHENGEFLGDSGFLLAQVATSDLNSNDRYTVTVKLIPNIGELALEGKQGTLLRRSHAALFEALARRPRAGNRSAGGGLNAAETNPYIQIPYNCVGTACVSGLTSEGSSPEYTFASSSPEKGQFVQQDLAAGASGRETPLLGANGKPIPDPHSGLFCAYNSGSVTVTIDAGGLSASLPVTIEAGSPEQPCGTVPVSKEPAAQQQAAPPVPPPAPAPAPAPAPVSAAPPVPPPPAVPAPSPRAPRALPPLVAPFFVPQPPPGFVLAFVPPPVPTPARPTPPSGTSAVEAVEREEEEESAPESVGNQALAYRAPEHEPSPAYILGIVILAAFAGAGVRRRPRRGRRELRVAPATISAMRAQRRLDTRRRPPH